MGCSTDKKFFHRLQLVPGNLSLEVQLVCRFISSTDFCVIWSHFLILQHKHVNLVLWDAMVTIQYWTNTFVKQPLKRLINVKKCDQKAICGKDLTHNLCGRILQPQPPRSRNEFFIFGFFCSETFQTIFKVDKRMPVIYTPRVFGCQVVSNPMVDGRQCPWHWPENLERFH